MRFYVFSNRYFKWNLAYFLRVY